jgi:adenylate cyclase
VIGDAVNTASRVEGLNTALATELLLTSEVRAHLSPGLAARCVDKGEHKVKGREQHVQVFTVDWRVEANR